MKLLLISTAIALLGVSASAQEVNMGTSELILELGNAYLSYADDVFTGETYSVGYAATEWLNAEVNYYEETDDFGLSADATVMKAMSAAVAYGTLDLAYTEDFTTLDTIVGVNWFVEGVPTIYTELGAKSVVSDDWLRAQSYAEVGFGVSAGQFAIVPAIRYDFEAEEYLGNVSAVFSF